MGNNTKKKHCANRKNDAHCTLQTSITSQTAIQDYMAMLVGQLREANRLGSALNYNKVLQSFDTFLGGKPLALSKMNEELIVRYNAFLVQKGLVRNSISFYMRTLRAVYNRAVRLRLVAQTYPFVEVYTGVDRTRKRAVSEQTIAQMMRLPLAEGTQLALARDLFIFSYCTRGMAFVDIAYLRRENLQGGVICYARHKTGQLMCIKVEPPVRRIIERYERSNSAYLFPIITSSNAEGAYNEYRKSLNRYNHLLGVLSKMLGCDSKLTTYTPRHSWATAARNHNIPISVISAGMGHSTEQTTQIYLSAIENNVIDDANRAIISSLTKVR